MSEEHAISDAGRGLGVLAGHIAGLALTATVLAAAVTGDPRIVSDAFFHEELVRDQLPNIVGHLVLSIVLWVTVYRLGRKAFGAFVRPEREKRVIKLARGTAVTETLIVLPIALLLYIGLAQLAINNIASTLTNVATFQAARAMWIWMPEAMSGRNGVGPVTAVERAHIAASLAVAPVASGDYIHLRGLMSGAGKQARAGIVASQLPWLTEDQGALATEPVLLALELLDTQGILMRHTRNNQSMMRGLDMSNFKLRSVRKFTFAYLSTGVMPIFGFGEIGAKVYYVHHMSMPLVGGAFGELSTIGGRTGYYFTYKRTMRLPTQYDSNPQLP